jgi:hypothetical protein
MFPDVVESFVRTWARDVVLALLVTSGFVCLLSVQNILSRYCFSLRVDGALPSVLGRVHPKHRSPCRQHARGDNRADAGQLTQFQSDVFDDSIAGLAAVDQLTIEAAMRLANRTAPCRRCGQRSLPYAHARRRSL